jgi:hypothetical protein
MELAWFLSPSIRGGTVRDAHSSGNKAADCGTYFNHRLPGSRTTVRASSQITRIETVRKLRRFFDSLFVVGALEGFPYAGQMRVTADGKNPACRHRKTPFQAGALSNSQPPTPERVAVGDVPQYDLFACRTEQNGSLLNYDIKKQRDSNWDNTRPR